MVMEGNTRKILLINTGGTIGMKTSSRGYIPVANYLGEVLRDSSILNDPNLSNEKYLQYTLPSSKHLNNIVTYDLLEYNPLLDSSNMSMEDWGKIAQDIHSNYDNYDAFVVLHGTDTMAFTASALSFMLESLLKTVIVTGSQIPLSELRNDGIDNLLGSLIIAGNYEIPEVGVFFDNNLYRGNRVEKISASDLGAFGSGNYPPLVKVGINIVVNWNAVRSTPNLSNLKIQKKMSGDIGTLRLFPGITKETIINFAKPPLKGLVLLTYGAGNAPTSPEFIEALKTIVDSGIIIVNCTQCYEGKVELDYETGKTLSEVGIINGSDLTVEAALTKLSYLLAQDIPTHRVKELMVENLRGELTESKKTKFSFKDKAFIKSVAEVLEGDTGEVKTVLEPILLCACASRGDVDQIHTMVINGADINNFDYDGRTPMHLAAAEGHVEMVKYLISKNAILNCKDRWGGTPLEDALRLNHTEIADLIKSRI